MPRAPRVWEPRAYILSSIFPNFLFPALARGPNSRPVRLCGTPKSPSPPENASPQIKFRKRGTKKRGPKRVFVLCFSVSARGPKGPRKRQTPKKRCHVQLFSPVNNNNVNCINWVEFQFLFFFFLIHRKLFNASYTKEYF